MNRAGILGLYTGDTSEVAAAGADKEGGLRPPARQPPEGGPPLAARAAAAAAVTRSPRCVDGEAGRVGERPAPSHWGAGRRGRAQSRVSSATALLAPSSSTRAVPALAAAMSAAVA